MKPFSYHDISQRFRFFLLLMLFLAHGLPVFSNEPAPPTENGSKGQYTVTDVIINIKSMPDSAAMKYEAMARSLIAIQPGDTYDPARLETAVGLLNKSSWFEAIFADTRTTGGGRKIIFDLTPFPLVREIRVKNSYPLFESDVLNVMTLVTGDTFTLEKLENQKPLILAMLKREGYPEPGVDLLFRKIKKSGHVDVTVTMDKGRPITISRFNITGNIAFKDIRLELMMKSDPGIYNWFFPKRFVRPDLEKDIKALLNFYRKKGFGDCRVSYNAVEKSRHHMAVTVKIEEGPLYEIEFTGNTSISDRPIKKQMPMFKNGNQSQIGLRKIASHIKSVYRENGFSETRVKIDTAPAEKEALHHLKATFVITEGQRRIVDRVSISGNRAIDTSEIRDQLLLDHSSWFGKTYYSDSVLSDDISAVQALYQKNGYASATVTPTLDSVNDSEKVRVHLDITEGVYTRVEKVAFSGLEAISEAEALETLVLKPGAPFREYMIRRDRNALSSLIAEKGYPFVKIDARHSLSADMTSATLEYDIDPGSRVFMGDPFFSGNFKTKRTALISEMEQKPHAPFSLKKMLASQKNIRDMDVFESVSFNPMGLEEQQETVHLLVSVEEKKPYFFEIGTGYETQKGFFLNSKTGNRNLFGENKYGWLSADVSQIGHRLETGYSEPRFWGTRVAMSTSLFWERIQEFNQDFGTDIKGTHLSFSKKVSARSIAGLGFRFEQRDLYGDLPLDMNKDISDEKKPRTVLGVTPSLSYDTRDSVIRPKQGIYGSIAVDFSKGIDRSLDDFIKYRMDARYFTTPVERITFAWIARFGYITPYGNNKDVPSDQLFFLGGASDVRGFDENMLSYDAEGEPLGGKLAISSSIEARIDLGYNFELPLFYDVGRIGETSIAGTGRKLRFSVGSGLRYLTPIGPVGLLYGKVVSPEKGEASSRIHFSIGYTF